MNGFNHRVCCFSMGAKWAELIPYTVSTLAHPSQSVQTTSLMLVRQVLDYVGSVCLCVFPCCLQLLGGPYCGLDDSLRGLSAELVCCCCCVR